MKMLLSALLLAASVSTAHAERWIVKNPRIEILSAIRSFEFGKDRFVVVETPRFSLMEASILANSESVVPDLKITLPADERAASPVADEEAWHVKRMKYRELPSQRSGKDIVVAVIDTGVDYTHRALANHVWTNPKEIPGNGVDDDGNGFIDDVHGYDFESSDSDPMDGDQHGTHCAGMIAAEYNAVNGAMGVAPDAKVMAVRIIGYKQVGFLSDAVAGIKYAADNGAKVLSNSWRIYRSWSSYDPSDENVELLRQAIAYAGSKGAIMVVAAGNESTDLDDVNGDPMYPGGFLGLDNLVVVGASTQSDSPASFTNYGVGHVMVAAPGENILSTIPGNGYTTMSGTSMATPLVAGSIARGLSAAFSNRDAIDRLVSTSLASEPWATKVKAGGIIDLQKYLANE